MDQNKVHLNKASAGEIYHRFREWLYRQDHGQLNLGRDKRGFLFAPILITIAVIITSCSLFMNTNLYPSAPKGPITVQVGGIDSLNTEMCEVSFQPPGGSGWQIHPGKWGPESVHLTFSRLHFLFLSEGIEIYSVQDTLLWDASTTNDEWISGLMDADNSWPELKDLKFTLESTEKVVIENRECHIVQFGASYLYKYGSSMKSYNNHGLAYVMKSPCGIWRTLLVFRWINSKNNKQRDPSFPPPEAINLLTDMVKSLKCSGSEAH